MSRYTMVSVMKMNACSVMMRMWNTAHAIAAHRRTQPGSAAAEHQRNQDEIISPAYMLPEQTQGERKGLGNQTHAFEQQVDREQKFGKGLERQFSEESAGPFHLDAVIQHEDKNR